MIFCFATTNVQSISLGEDTECLDAQSNVCGHWSSVLETSRLSRPPTSSLFRRLSTDPAMCFSLAASSHQLSSFLYPSSHQEDPPNLAKVNLKCFTLEVQLKLWRVRRWSSQEVSGTPIRRGKLESVKAYLSPGAWRWTCVCRTTFLLHELQPSDNEVSICEDGSLRHMHTSASAQVVTVTVPAAELLPFPTQLVVRSGRPISTGMRLRTRRIPTSERKRHVNEGDEKGELYIYSEQHFGWELFLLHDVSNSVKETHSNDSVCLISCRKLICIFHCVLYFTFNHFPAEAQKEEVDLREDSVFLV